MKQKLFILALCLNFSCLAQNLEICRSESGLLGFCSNGNVVIPQIYYDVLEFVNGHAPVLAEDKWAIINTSGDQVVKPAYDDVIKCVSIGNTLLVQIDEKWQLIDFRGNKLTDLYEFGELNTTFQLNGAVSEITSNSWLPVMKRGKWGAIDIKNVVKIDFDFDWLTVLSAEINGTKENISVIIKKKDKFGWKQIDDTKSTGLIFDHYLGQNNDHVFFEQSGRLVVLNLRSGENIVLRGKHLYKLKNDQNMYGLVSSERNEVIIPFKYNTIDLDIIPNHVVFGNYEKVGLADSWGNVILQPEYLKIQSLAINPMYLAVKNFTKKIALVAVDAHIPTFVTDYKYTFLRPTEKGLKIGIGNQHGYLSHDGTETWD